MLVASGLIIAACDSGTDSKTTELPSTPGQVSTPASTVPTAASSMAPPAVPAAAVTQASWAPDALEELVAPIALYPDALLGQILAASVNAQEVLDAGNWLLQNESLKGDQLDAAATKAGFGPAMRALVQFPTVVDMMCQQIDWTKQLGSAFTSDQKAVLDAVQRLRVQAANAGNLKSTPEQKVERRTEGDKVIVEVKPADPKVVYVPQYDPQAVYAPAPAPAPATTAPPASSTTSSGSTVSTGAAVAGGLLAFGVGVVLGKALDDDDDYCYPHWSSGVVFYGPRPFYPPAYVYRPAYGPAFHPAYRYTSPPGYRYGYNNANINVNRNVVVNNNNYFNRFSNNRNLSVDNTRNSVSQTRYAGATDRPNATATPARLDSPRAERAAHVDRGYGNSTRNPEAPSKEIASRDATAARDAVATRDVTATRDAAAARNRERPDRAQAPTEIANQPAEQRVAPRESALAGARAGDGGSFERAASARGRASAGGRDLRSARSR